LFYLLLDIGYLSFFKTFGVRRIINNTK
jgi:hypothetical protein